MVTGSLLAWMVKRKMGRDLNRHPENPKHISNKSTGKPSVLLVKREMKSKNMTDWGFRVLQQIQIVPSYFLSGEHRQTLLGEIFALFFFLGSSWTLFPKVKYLHALKPLQSTVWIFLKEMCACLQKKRSKTFAASLFTRVKPSNDQASINLQSGVFSCHVFLKQIRQASEIQTGIF